MTIFQLDILPQVSLLINYSRIKIETVISRTNTARLKPFLSVDLQKLPIALSVLAMNSRCSGS